MNEPALPVSDVLQDAEVTQALRVTGLSHRLGGREVLRKVDFTVPAGRFVVLLGPNGAGKTTLFSLVTRLFSSRQGRIEIFGQDLRRRPGQALSLLGVVFQQRSIDLDLSAWQNLAYHAALHGLPIGEARQRMAVELVRVGLEAEAGRKVRSFSGGELRRLEIARALLHQPRLLLCDEATVGLDVRSRAAILSDVRGLVRERGLTVLWATHLIDEVEPEDITIILHRGRVLRQGSAGAITTELGVDRLQEAFQKLTEGA